MKHLSFIISFLLFTFCSASVWADGSLPKMSTDTEMHYYLLRSSYSGQYVATPSSSQWTSCSTDASSTGEANVFYFKSTNSMAEDGSLVVKLYRRDKNTAMVNYGEWGDEGTDITITPDNYNGVEGIKINLSGSDYFNHWGSQELPYTLYNFIETTEDDISAPAVKLENAINGGLGTNIGTYKSTRLQDGIKALQTYDATYSAFYAATRNLPVSGHYYTIANANNGKFVQESYTNKNSAGNDKLACTTQAANIMPSLWQFEQCTVSGKTDLFYIKAANSGLYMGLTEWNYCESNGGVHVVNSIKDNNIGIYDIFDKTHVSISGSATLVHYTADDRSTDHRGTMHYQSDDVLHSWNATNEGLNNWNIVEVTSIPVAISSVKYATVCLPCAVTIPSGVGAYIGTVDTEKSQMKLTALSGTIPANTPVILIAEAEGTYNFVIDYSNTTAAPENALKGTLIPEDVASTATAYTLQNSASDGIGLYKITDETDRTIPANKAYYGSTTEGNTTKMISFTFADDSLTGIQTITSDNASQTYYDLNGRRVLFPVHGVYVNGRGEKVFIK